MPPCAATLATRPTMSINHSAPSSAAAKSKVTTSRSKTPKTMSTNVQGRTRSSTTGRPSSTFLAPGMLFPSLPVNQRRKSYRWDEPGLVHRCFLTPLQNNPFEVFLKRLLRMPRFSSFRLQRITRHGTKEWRSTTPGRIMERKVPAHFLLPLVLSASSPLPDALRLPLPHSTSLLDATLTGISLAHLSYAVQCALHLSPDTPLPALHDSNLNNDLSLSWVPHLATAAKAHVKLVCVRLYKRIESLTQSPPLASAATATSNNPVLGSPSARTPSSHFCMAHLWRRWSSRPTG